MKEMYCSFCEKPTSEVALMIKGRYGCICDKCVSICVDMCINKLHKTNINVEKHEENNEESIDT